MDTYRSQVESAAAFVADHIDHPPRVAILTGTGLGNVADLVTAGRTLDYDAIPHFPVATAPSHRGRLVAGQLHGKPVMVLQGRLHLYEGYSPRQVTFPVRVMQCLGVETLILCNAAGGLNSSFQPGDIMLISDHINLTGQTPLIGANIDDWGLRFPDMTAVYGGEPAAAAVRVARLAGIPLKRGVYAGLTGPSLETPAEIRYLKTIGADAVGFSTVQEAIAANHGGVQIVGLSVITNINDPDRPEPATLEAVVAQAAQTAPQLTTLIAALAETLND